MLAAGGADRGGDRRDSQDHPAGRVDRTPSCAARLDSHRREREKVRKREREGGRVWEKERSDPEHRTNFQIYFSNYKFQYCVLKN